MNTATIIDVYEEIRQYVETALWSSHDNADESGGEPMDANYGPDDLAPAAHGEMAATVRAFIDGNRADCELWTRELGTGQVGHDLWLTQNGHGAGFWDRFSTGPAHEAGERLTEAARPYGSVGLYVGDDGKVYAQ